jgi:hypothetical protein
MTESLIINGNEFVGTIPSEIGNLRLFNFYAHFNRFSGPIPDGLWMNSDLVELRLDNNNFNGTLSQRIGDLSELADLRLSNNSFTGNLPALLFRLDRIGKCKSERSACTVAVEVLLLMFVVPLLPFLFRPYTLQRVYS